MKQYALLILLFVTTLNVGSQPKTPPKADLDTLERITLPTVANDAFKPGEYLRFRLNYGLIDAGEAELRVKNSSRTFLSRDAYHIIGTGKTLGAFNWFFKVRDRYETFIDREGIFPWKFVRDIREGGYEKEETYVFHQHKGAVRTDEGKVYKIPEFSQDMLSTFYYARTIDFSNAEAGQVFTIPTFVDEEEYPMQIRLVGREKLESRTGTYNCLKFVPVVQEGRIFEDDEDLQVWITDDQNKIPVLAKAKVLVGSIKMELVEYDNLANPIAKID